MTGLFDKSVGTSSSTEITPAFDFHAVHNGESCIESLNPSDAHTPNAFRFTIAMLCTIYNVAERTMRDNIDSLLEDEEIAYCDISQYAIPGGNNRVYETALYNLTVLNRLGMCCFRKNKAAKKVRDKFNDVLVERETNTPPAIPNFSSPAEAARAWADMYEKNEAAQKALAEEKAAHEETRADLADEIEDHRHDDRVRNGRCGGITKNRNHYKTKSSDLADENESLKGENVILKQLAKYNPMLTVAQWARKNPKAFINFAIPDDNEGRKRFYEAYEKYARFLSGVPAFHGCVMYDHRTGRSIISWSLVCEIARSGVVEHPDGEDLTDFCIY